MNSELVKQEIAKIISEEVNAAWRQYPAGKAQQQQLTELGIIDLMPVGFGHTDAKVVLEATQEKVTGNFDDVVTFKSHLMELINEEEQQATENALDAAMDKAADEEQKVFDLMSEAGNITLYAPAGYKSKAEHLAEKLDLKDARGNYSTSALFRYLIDKELNS